MQKNTSTSRFVLFIVLAFAVTARAQVYVENQSLTGVSVYGAAGGTANTTLISGLGSSTPYGYANQLMLAGSSLLVGSWYGTISKYDAATGAVQNKDFITGLAFDSMTGFAFSGTTLYTSTWQGTIKKWDVTGAPTLVNGAFVSTGVIGSTSGLALAGTRLFTSDQVNQTIREYNAVTGALVNDHFISGLNNPYGIAAFGSVLLVGNTGNHAIDIYDINTGGLLQANFITGVDAGGIAVSAIPEPSTYVLLCGLAAAGAAVLWRRRPS